MAPGSGLASIEFTRTSLVGQIERPGRAPIYGAGQYGLGAAASRRGKFYINVNMWKREVGVGKVERRKVGVYDTLDAAALDMDAQRSRLEPRKYKRDDEASQEEPSQEEPGQEEAGRTKRRKPGALPLGGNHYLSKSSTTSNEKRRFEVLKAAAQKELELACAMKFMRQTRNARKTAGRDFDPHRVARRRKQRHDVEKAEATRLEKQLERLTAAAEWRELHLKRLSDALITGSTELLIFAGADEVDDKEKTNNPSESYEPDEPEPHEPERDDVSEPEPETDELERDGVSERELEPKPEPDEEDDLAEDREANAYAQAAMSKDEAVRSEMTASYTDFQVHKVRAQAQLMHAFLTLIGKEHYSVSKPGLKLIQLSAKVIKNSPWKGKMSKWTLLDWYNDIRKNEGSFRKDGRGSYARESWILFIVHNEDLLLVLKRWIKVNLAQLTVNKTQQFIASTILPKITAEEKKNFKIPDKIPSVSQVHQLMLHDKVGCKYTIHKKCYYVDAHERPDVRAARKEYLDSFFEKERLMYKWIQITEGEADTLRKKCPTMAAGHHFKNADGVEKVEFHVDDSQAFDTWRVNDPQSPYADIPMAQVGGIFMGGNLSVRRPRGGERPIIQLGQDEATYKAFVLPKDTWTLDNYQPIRPKSDGPGLMLSGFVGSPFYFGVPVPEWVIDKVNEARGPRELKYVNEAAAVAVNNKRKECVAARRAAKAVADKAKKAAAEEAASPRKRRRRVATPAAGEERGDVEESEE